MGGEMEKKIEACIFIRSSKCHL